MLALRKRYRLDSDTIAIVPCDSGRPVAIQIPQKGIVEVIARPNEGETFTRVRWDGNVCKMFTQDLQERGTEIAVPGPSPF